MLRKYFKKSDNLITNEQAIQIAKAETTQEEP